MRNGDRNGLNDCENYMKKKGRIIPAWRFVPCIQHLLHLWVGNWGAIFGGQSVNKLIWHFDLKAA